MRIIASIVRAELTHAETPGLIVSRGLFVFADCAAFSMAKAEDLNGKRRFVHEEMIRWLLNSSCRSSCPRSERSRA